MPANLAAALNWAKSGLFIFPCVSGTKKPFANSSGLSEATQNPETIRRWWTIHPDANIAAVPGLSGHLVLDIDAHKKGIESLESLISTHGPLPATFTVATPRGGRHYWFKGAGRSTTETIAPGIDTKSRRGYVLLPPSVAEGKVYTIANNSPFAEPPPWLMALLFKPAQEKKAATTAALDLPANLERAEARLKKYAAEGHIAIEGQGGDSLTYRIAAELLDLGVAPETVTDLMVRIWNPRCEPPWDANELSQKVENAANYRQNEIGAKAELPAAEVFKLAVSPDVLAPKTSRFTPIPASDFARKFQPPQWLLKDILPRNGTVQLVGPPKSFKTFLALDIALGITTGQETFGQIPEIGSVVYIAGENAHAIALKHVPAWRLARGIEGDIPFWIIPTMPRAAEFEEVKEAGAEIFKASIKPALIVIDTATRALRGLDENSAKDMGLFSAACEYLQRETGATIMTIRHTGKNAARGSRGSNVLEGDFDTLMTAERQEKSLLVKISITEQRNALEPAEPFYFGGRPIGSSLAFYPTTVKDWQTTDDEFSQAHIFATLMQLRAVSDETAVPTAVLAAELGKTNPESSDNKISRKLHILGQSTLKAYIVPGQPIKWRVPLP
ncbi:MAG: bifunctional DNA primase/polymerase [Patescibacteria group bacterium]|nr:bifunctional DNA primase/polymerase [Patescibacteria group bacterium]